MRWDNLFNDLSSSFKAKENLQNAQAEYFQRTFDLLSMGIQTRLKQMQKHPHPVFLNIHTHVHSIPQVQLIEVGNGWISAVATTSGDSALHQGYSFYIIPLHNIESLTIQSPADRTVENTAHTPGLSPAHEATGKTKVTSIKIMLKITHVLSDLRRKMTPIAICTSAHQLKGKIKNVYQDHLDLILIAHNNDPHTHNQNSTVIIPIQSIQLIKTHTNIYQ